MLTRRHLIAIFIMLAIFGACTLFNTGSFNIYRKNLQADMGAGLNRTVTVYTSTGVSIKSWHGKIDLVPNDNWVNMLIDGNKRIVIKGGITIVEEHVE